MKILITGVAGFIGFHLARRLINLGYQIIGIDNLNNYYDIKLKKSRLILLNKLGLKFHKVDISKKKSLHEFLINSEFDIIGINDPSMATRKSKLYHDMILERVDFFQPVPRIDEFNVPQGLAGNSAYVIKPAGAVKMLQLAQEHGMWPNDALMCYQLIEKLGVTRNFYTRVQGLRSTTTL